MISTEGCYLFTSVELRGPICNQYWHKSYFVVVVIVLGTFGGKGGIVAEYKEVEFWELNKQFCR